jgi:hypothetical protein
MAQSAFENTDSGTPGSSTAHGRVTNVNPEWRKRIQIILGIFLIAALVRIGIIYYGRKNPGELRKPAQPTSSYRITSDDYVTPPKVFPYDVRSAARELAGKTVWVRSGNQLPYYRYSAHHVDFSRQAGLLGPLEKLELKDAVLQKPPRAGNQRYVMAVFSKPGEPAQYVVTVGTETGGTFNFFINDVFFLDDPHKLYSHWPADIWKAIDRHEAKQGMNELQVSLALGTSASAGSGDIGNRTMEYTNAGKPVKVTFENNKAVEVAPEKPQ